MTNQTSTPTFAVIGAGIAGLSCATVLQAAGATVRLFDKSAAASGRMSTRRGDGWQCDHGAQYFTAGDPAFRAEVTRWQDAGVAAPWSPRLHARGTAPAQDLQPAPARFVGVPRMTAPARLLAASLAVSAKTTLNGIRRETNGWQLSSLEHGALDGHFDAVLLAVPAPQAVPLLRQPAPALADLAGTAVMRGCWALMARFAAPLELQFDAAEVAHGPLAWAARDGSKPGRGAAETWALHARADWSEAHLEDDAATVAAVLLQAFGELGAPTPQAWTAHRWRYAFSEPLGDGCAWRADLGLGLCGDWLNGGNVQGAWLSGRQLAHEALQSMRPQ